MPDSRFPWTTEDELQDRREWFDYWTSVPRYVREARLEATRRIAERKFIAVAVEAFDNASAVLDRVQSVFRSSDAQIRKAQKDAIKAGNSSEGTPE